MSEAQRAFRAAMRVQVSHDDAVARFQSAEADAERLAAALGLALPLLAKALAGGSWQLGEAEDVNVAARDALRRHRDHVAGD